MKKRVLSIILAFLLVVTGINFDGVTAGATTSQEITFTGLNSATEFNVSAGRWYLYLTPDTTLPGGAGTSYGLLQMQVGNNELFDVELINSGHAGTVFITPWPDNEGTNGLKATVAAGTKVVLKAGETTGNSYKLKLTTDFVFYADGNGGFTTEAPHETQVISFTGIHAATEFNTSAGRWYLYLTPNTSLPGAVGTNYGLLQMQVGDNEPFDVELINSDQDGTVFITPWPDNDGTNGLKATVAAGTKVVLKAGETTNNTCNVTLSTDFVFYADGNGGFTTEAPKTYSPVQFTAINAATEFNESSGRWFFYLTPQDTLPGVTNTAFQFLKMSVNNGPEFDVEVIHSGYEGTAFITPNPAYVPGTITEDMKIVLKTGKAYATDNSCGLELTEEFVIYANEYGLSTDGFIAPPNYEKMTFTGVDVSTNYNSEHAAWFFYLTPSIVLPGTVNTTYYEGITMDIDGQKKISLSIYKSEHAGTAWLMVSDELLPETLTKNTKVTIQAGKALCHMDGMGIELIEDFVLYGNQYGWSTEGYLAPPSYTYVAFEGLNKATGYSAAHDGWLFYIQPDKTIPGEVDKTAYSSFTIQVGTKTETIEVIKASHENTAFVYVPSSLLPKTITKNTEIVIKAGTAKGNDGKNMLRLTKDFTIYANQYGLSTSGYLAPPTIKQKGAQVTLDRLAEYGGSENGIYLDTNDIFPVDTTWATFIYALSFDADSGVFYNGQKIDTGIRRYAEGKLYIPLIDAGITAKDRDKVTIKGTFALSGVGVVYQETNFYFNGKIWNTKYEAAKSETYTQISGKGINNASSFNNSRSGWDVYVDLNGTLPGEIDKIGFNTLAVEVNGQTVDTTVYHSFQGSMFFTLSEEYLPQDSKDGTKVVIKAGKALAADKSTGIHLTKDFTFYTYKGSLTELKPTSQTEWQQTEIFSMFSTVSHNDANGAWMFHLKLKKPLTTESGTLYLQLPININGKMHYVRASQDGEYLFITIPDSILAKDSKIGTIAIKAGAKTYANAGRNGLEITEDWEAYLFNGVISEQKFTQVEFTETKISALHTVSADKENGNYQVYLRMTNEIPGTAWYERYEDFVYYYNGKAINTYACKSESSNNKYMSFQIAESQVGTVKEGDMVTIKADTKMTCGGYEILIQNEFMLRYYDGMWSQYMESDVAVPKDIGSIWSVARFDSEYIPLSDKGAVLYSNEDVYNKITSLEPMKDFTISFNSKKIYDDETTPSFGIILRGNSVDEEQKMSKDLLYGYVITFSALENADGSWSGFINLWKNGENYSLLDQYRIGYVHDTADHPFFQYDKDYNYEFSIYNVNDTTVCIMVKVNGKLALCHYDEAGSDPFDPAINAGTFEIYAACPNYITDDVVELSEVIAEKEQCEVGSKVRVAVTYPSILEGAEFTVDGDGATVENGIFMATKVGTYKVSGSYNGKKLAETTIVVVEKQKEEVGTTKSIPVWPFVVSAVVVIGMLTVAVCITKKKQRKGERNE